MKKMFGSSLPPVNVVCRRAHVLFVFVILVPFPDNCKRMVSLMDNPEKVATI
jgi:hypothetical protein